MTIDRAPGDGPGTDDATLENIVRALPDLLGEVPGRQAAGERVLADLAGVQVAHEELRVAEEEMRVQQEQITQLLLQHDTDRRRRGQLSALVPVGLCVTDGNGALIEGNPALARQLGAPLPRLHGKPLGVFLAPEDVPAFRSALRSLASGTSTEYRLTATVRPRHGPPGRAHLFGFTEEVGDHRPSAARIQWVLVPESASAGPQGGAEPATRAPVAVDEDAIPASEVIGLATALAELSALPIGQLDRQRLLSRMATLVRGAVPGADWVSITVGPPTEPQLLGSDSTEAQEFDGRQVRAGAGPCWTAYDTRAVVISDDVTRDARWPALARVAGKSAVRSVLAMPVQEDGTTTGAVNVYSGRVAAFGPAGRRIGELAAAAVASVLQNVAERESMKTLADNLNRALTSRAVIDQAKGVIMGRLGVNAEDAFARLVNLSSRLNVKVRDLATLITEGHVDAFLDAGD
jgi:PAS domain-containing protein